MAFEATLQRWSGPAAWVFVSVPEDHAPQRAGPFGRVPVVASVDGYSWKTSVWQDKSAGWLLPVPAKIRRGKDDGDLVLVELEVDPLRV